MSRATRLNNRAGARDAVSPTYRLPLNAMTTQNRGALPRIVSLIAGTEDETKSASSATITADTTNYVVGRQGWQMSMAGAVTGRLTVTPISPASSGLLTVPAAQAVGLWIYLPDATKVSSVIVTLFQNTANTIQWSRANTSGTPQTLVTGWNLLRWAATEGTTTAWNTLNRVDIQVVTNAATTATVGHLYLECPEKAKMIFILDRGYRSFVTMGGLARMRANQIPITWALDITLLGTSVGTINEVVTEGDIATYAAQGDSISFHSWDGSVTAAYTAAQCRTDTAQAVKWLQSRGYKGRIWRAAWVQNSATNAAATRDLVLGEATSTNGSGFAIWPPRDRWDINRWGAHGRTNTEVDTQFATWQLTNSLLLVYTHGIDAGGGNNITPAEWDYFMTKVEAGIAAGWLEGVTFEDLWLRSGFQWGDMRGAPSMQTVVNGVATIGQTL